MRSLAAAVVFAALFGACGDGLSSHDGGPGDDAGEDARPEFMCWPSIDPIPRGTLELGKGGSEFSQIPDTLNLEWGGQEGFMVRVWPRMTGIDAGVQGAPVNFSNPGTRVRGRFVDSDARLQKPGDCAERGYYAPNTAGSYDYYQPVNVAFDTCWGTDSLVGKQLEITAELIDAAGSYATDRKVITVANILDPAYQDIHTTPGCGQ